MPQVHCITLHLAHCYILNIKNIFTYIYISFYEQFITNYELPTYSWSIIHSLSIDIIITTTLLMLDNGSYSKVLLMSLLTTSSL